MIEVKNNFYVLSKITKIYDKPKTIQPVLINEEYDTNKMEKIRKRTLNELRQVKTYGYTPPSPSKEKDKKIQKTKTK